ncbi:MAG: alkaline phosphatase family protein, partial [Bdellovibrionia bacterium]
LGALFTCSRGTELTSFTSRSLTLPSWATILSGHEQDTHGIRSNTPFSRITGRLTHDYLDPKRDILIPKNWTKNRAYQMLEENTGKKSDQVWLPSYFQKDEVVFNYMPITNGSLPMAGKVISAALDQLGAFFNDSGYVPSQIDRVSSEQLAQAIKNDRDGKLRLVMVWYSQVDVASHHNNRELPDAYRNIDQAADLILREARFHPHLKDATVFLISDHGHNGGYGPFDENSTIYQAQQKLEALDQGPFLANTDFNLVEFLAGEFRGYEQYPFVVASAESPEPRFYNGLQKKFKLRSSRSIYPRNRGPATALLDTSGDSLAQLYLRPSTSSDWNHRLSFFELTHFAHEKSKKVLNLIADLLELKILNLSTTDPGLTRHLLQLTEQHPVKLIAMPLVGDPARDSVEPLGASADTGTSTREPVLVIGRSPEPQSLKTALIFTRSTPGQADRFRYVVVKHFTQDPQGVVSAEVSTDPQDDPLHYIGEVDGAEDPSTWRTDRQWLTLTRDHPQPTAIFSLARTLTLAPRFNDSEDAELNHETKKNRRAEIPDFILLANPGFGFHSGAPMESDHGGLMREEVRNSFFISSLNPNEFTRHVRLDMPVFSRDFLPTILSFLGYPETQTHFLPADETQSISLKNQIDSANERTLSEMSP